MSVEKRLLKTPLDVRPDTSITVDGVDVDATGGELLVEAINRALSNRHLPQVCDQRAMGPIETCDTCMVELDGKLVRACSRKAAAGMNVVTEASEPTWRSARPSTAYSRITISTAPSATTIMAIARFTIRSST